MSSRRRICCRSSPRTRTSWSRPSIRSATTASCASTRSQPPFDNPKLRQAVLNLVDQKDYMLAIAGNEKYWKTCAAFFGCGTPFETEAGADALRNGPNLAKARALIKESGYNGEKIVLMSATDQPIVHAQALVTNAASEGCRAQRRVAGDGLGHADHPPRLEGADRQGRLEHLPHLDRRPRTSFRRRSTSSSAATATRHGSAGRPTRRSKSCSTPGSRPPTSPRKEGSPPTSRPRPMPAKSPTCRPASSSCRPPTAKISGIIVAPVVFLWNVEKK